MENLTQYYVTQTALLRLQRRLDTLKEELRQAKFGLREANCASAEYEGSLRAFLGKFSGKAEETRERLRRKLREAEGKHTSLLQEQERLKAELEQTEKELSSLPSAEDLRRQAEPKAWAVLEAAYCAEALLPLLEENHEALLEYRKVLRGEYPVLSLEERQELCAEPNVCAERCLPWLERLGEALEILETPLDLGGYYASPAAYVVSAAARHNQLDRLNNALTQVERLQKTVKGLR